MGSARNGTSTRELVEQLQEVAAQIQQQMATGALSGFEELRGHISELSRSKADAVAVDRALQVSASRLWPCSWSGPRRPWKGLLVWPRCGR